MSRIQFGETVKGFDIPVLNEREVRAAAGLLFVFVFIAIQRVIYLFDFTFIKFAATFFVADFYLRVFVGPRYSPTLILGRWIVRNQTPEYVGAEQKRFAWIIGVILGSIMFVSLCVLNVHSPVTGIICLICQIFLFFEAAFGICLGCLMYPWVFRKKPQYCPGEVCEIKDRHPIQQISKAQWILVLAFLLAFAALIPTLKDRYQQGPELIWGVEKPS